MQDDSLLLNLTVLESMMCAANLKLSESLSHEKKSAVVRTSSINVVKLVHVSVFV